MNQDDVARFLRTNPQLAAPGTLGARIAAGEPVVHVLDRKAEAAYREGEPHRRASVDLGGGRTTVAVPLTKDRRLVGAIEIYRQHVEAFSDKQIALLQNFAAQAPVPHDSVSPAPRSHTRSAMRCASRSCI